MSSTPATEITIETAVEQAKRAFALGKYEQSVEHYATALEIATETLGERSLGTADLYFSYGKALIENGIVQTSVLGKEQPEEANEEETTQVSGSGAGASAPILSFSGDAEDDGEDKPIDLFGQAAAMQDDDDDDEDNDEEGGGEDDGEPEDDFNAAWEVLDLARAIYEKEKDANDDDEVKLKLADTYIALGDVSLETEKFDQAITDYEAGLALKTDLLPVSSRQIAEAHYKLSMVLDLTSGRLSDAITHAEKALESVEARLAELRDGLAGQLPPLPPKEAPDAKGKGKATSGARLIRDDYVQNMTKTQIENESKELAGLRDDLALKVEELKTSPNEAIADNAPAMAAQALDQLLGMGPGSVASSGSAAPMVVNDLTSIVKKKKKVVPTAVDDSTASGKRKADADAEPLNAEKKVKLDTPEA